VVGVGVDGGIIAVKPAMGAESKDIGKKGESAAAQYLEKLGWRIAELNYRTTRGEIDIVAWDSDMLVFVEVKNYSARSFYLPSFAIDKNKRQCIIRSAKIYLFRNNIRDTNCRFDVITIYKDYNGGRKIEHYKNAFDIGRG